MVKIPRKGARALPRTFNAHNFCVVGGCGCRATARVRFPNGLLMDVCTTCLSKCPKEAEVVEQVT